MENLSQNVVNQFSNMTDPTVKSLGIIGGVIAAFFCFIGGLVCLFATQKMGDFRPLAVGVGFYMIGKACFVSVLLIVNVLKK